MGRFEDCCLLEGFYWPTSLEHLLWLTLFDPYFGSEFICAWKGQRVRDVEKANGKNCTCLKDLRSQPLAAYLEFCFQKGIYNKLRQGFPFWGQGGWEGVGMWRDDQNHSEWLSCQKAYWELDFVFSHAISFEIVKTKEYEIFEVYQKGARIKILETLCYRVKVQILGGNLCIIWQMGLSIRCYTANQRQGQYCFPL